MEGFEGEQGGSLKENPDEKFRNNERKEQKR